MRLTPPTGIADPERTSRLSHLTKFRRYESATDIPLSKGKKRYGTLIPMRPSVRSPGSSSSSTASDCVDALDEISATSSDTPDSHSPEEHHAKLVIATE
jgi:hypothetical protein